MRSNDTQQTVAPSRAGDVSYMVWALAAATLLFHLATSRGYGYFRDELYYLACSEHPALGYVDFPPLLPLVLRFWRAIAGDSIPALRLPAALAAAVTVLLTARIVRRLGGGRRALVTALGAVMLAPIYLGTFGILTPNAFDVVLWTAAMLLVLRVLNQDAANDWLALGVVLGVGFLNKHSMVFLVFGLVFGLVLTPSRQLLRGRMPWIAIAIAAGIVLPHVAWQATHGWPTVEFMASARLEKNLARSPIAFVLEQILVLNPGTAPVWIAGLVSFWRRDGGRDRALVWAYLAILALMIVGGGKAYYLTPFYPVLFAAGAVAIERSPRWRRTVPAVVAIMVALGIVLAPLAKPILPEEKLIRYAKVLGQDPRAGIGERHELGLLPQHFADQHGWPELAATVAGVYAHLAPDERSRACIFASNYGEAGAIDFFGPALGLPHAVSRHNSYWLWGPDGCDFSTVIVIGLGPEDVRGYVGSVETVAEIACRYCMPYERRPILVTRGITVPRDLLWHRAKLYR